MNTLAVLRGAGLIVLFVAACAGGPSATPGGASTSSPAAPPAGTPAGCNDAGGGTAVAAVDFAFEPGLVNASVGDTVTWTNNGDAPHTVTFEGGPDCGEIASGESVSRTFDTAGTFAYLCSIHPSMVGTVDVTE